MYNLYIIFRLFKKPLNKKEENIILNHEEGIEVTTIPSSFTLEVINENVTPASKTLSYKSKEKLIDQAVRLHLQGNILEAEKYYKYCINQGVNDYRIFCNYGIILKSLGNLKEAETLTRKAIELKPDCADSYSNLGSILAEVGNLEEAESLTKKAICLYPNSFDYNYNLGTILFNLSKSKEAEISMRKAIELKPDSEHAHSNLGSILKDLGYLDEAEKSYSHAIRLNPKLKSSLINRAKLFFEKKEFYKALKDADNCNSKDSRVFALEILYALGRIDEIYERIDKTPELDDKDISLAAFTSFISEKQKKNTSKLFCRDPLSFMRFSNIQLHRSDYIEFINQTIQELSNIKTIWEPRKNTTVNGFHTPININLFSNSSRMISQLQSIILKEIDRYYLIYEQEDCSYIKNWPSKKRLVGWHVILKKQGYQKAHIHPSAWLSGVIYLKVVPSLDQNEGAIEFSLNGPNYSDLNSPKLTYEPNLGDMVLFPSSLHHRTIPFSTDTDRIVIAFDLMPSD